MDSIKITDFPAYSLVLLLYYIIPILTIIILAEISNFIIKINKLKTKDGS
tara:strand:- start:327 stop:476 length:150 start_codon:yes stop_codon:yes gene_type:complete